MALRPPVIHSRSKDRPHVRTWSDASGVDRDLAVFVYIEASAAWHVTSVTVPDSVWDQLEETG